MKIIASTLSSIIFIFLNATVSFGSAFIGDQITINGESWEIAGKILSTNEKFHQFEKYAKKAYEEEPDSIKYEQHGYDTRAYWVIEDGKLCLEKIDLYFITDSQKCYELTKQFFPELVHDGKIVVDWDMNCTFRLQSGDLLRINTGGFQSAHRKQMFLSIKNGKVIFSRQFGENPYENGKSIHELLNDYLSLYYMQFKPIGQSQNITLTCSRNEGEITRLIIISEPEINPNIIINGLYCSPWNYCFVSKEGKKYICYSGLGKAMITQVGIDEWYKRFHYSDPPIIDFDNLPILYEDDTLVLSVPDGF